MSRGGRGSRVGGDGGAAIRLVLAGGAAGLLAGALQASRVTTDCDVPWNPSDAEGKAVRDQVRAAATRVASRLGLSQEWLSFRCAMYAWRWPLGWEARCEAVEGDFGVLQVMRLSRGDLIAAKVMGAARRPQDRQDLLDLAPTREELDLAESNLDRVESEHPGREALEIERLILQDLRSRL